MGGSGTGKSTLLGLLNGTISPSSGRLLLNGHDIHAEPAAVRGVFGFIPQDDLLFEDLTVFDNLYYAARLCLAQLPEDQIVRRVRDLLAELGQADTADLKVGSPLEKIISGGQRKRLNIALELIREPPILFVDEPTSGLSSADSELVMSLLKQQATRGRLVFVVIHQPSSKILRMCDALWVLDQGGWPIFRGSPLEALAYFRSRGGLPGAEEAICPGCGSLNPEQLFDIIEARLLDPAGSPTHEHRVAPRTWFRRYQDYEATRSAPPLPPVHLTLPATVLGAMCLASTRSSSAKRR
jgi:ABC transport system ATP-binding/permease protein